jgi:hypothetical protein
MSIDIAGERTPFIAALDFWMPEIRRLLRQGTCQAFGSASVGHLRQKVFGVAITIGSLAPGKPR